MSYDSARAVMVMFGGDRGDGTSLGDTWELDATSWSQGPAAPPALEPRQYMAMAFDRARSRTVMYGGDSASGFYNDTWEYDGIAWTPGAATPATLDPRCCMAMVFDQVRSRIMMVGGENFASRETWNYDGAAWTPGDGLPLGRSAFAIAWDTARSRALVFGGDRAGNLDRALWEYCDGCEPAGASVAGEGAGASNAPRVRVFAPDGAPATADFNAYGAGGWGVRVGAGNIDTVAPDEILTGPGPGPSYGPQARGFKVDGTAVAKVNFYAYGTLKYGVNVSGSSVDGDGPSEILTGPGPGAVFGPHVRGFNFDGVALSSISGISLFAYGTLRYGVNVGGGDVDADQDDELVTGPGPGVVFGPQVRGFDYDGTATQAIAKINFSAFPVAQYGALARAGSVDGDSFAELVAAVGPGPGSSFPARLRGFDYDAGAVAPLPGYDATPFVTSYGGRLGLTDLGGPIRVELLAAPGPDPAAAASVLPYDYGSGVLRPVEGRYLAFGMARHGVDVAGGDMGLP